MSNTTKKTATQVANEVASFQNEIESVRNTATKWHNTEYATSNARLYGIFAKLYAVWETLVDLDNANTKKREWIEAAVCKKGVSLPKKPTTHQLLINYAFFVEGIDYQLQQKRLSTYTRVFKTATATDGVYADNIAEWITSNGGIENIRQQNTKSAITKAERISNGKQLLIDALSIGTTSTKETKANASKADEVVLLVGIQNADGSISVRHTIYEKAEGSSISGKTAIDTALCNVFSKYNEQNRKNAAKTAAESDAKATADSVSEIAEAEVAHNKSFQNEIKKEAA
jgi:hypothetical protein